MRRDEHLMVRVMEECDELSQRVSKALTFGLSEVQEGQPLTNRERLMGELWDLLGVLDMLGFVQVAGGRMAVDQQAIQAKREKVERYMVLARERGALEPDVPPRVPVSTMCVCGMHHVCSGKECACHCHLAAPESPGRIASLLSLLCDGGRHDECGHSRCGCACHRRNPHA